MLIELAREYRRIVTYDEVPPVLRHAILAAEDKNFFSHSGVDYGALPAGGREDGGALARAVVERATSGCRLRLPQGGSTLTQQLVRGYFLRDLTSRRERRRALPRRPRRAAAAGRGPGRARPPTSSCASSRRSACRSGSSRRCAQRYGSRERAKQEILARYASFIYLGHGRYGFAAGSEYYFGKPLASYTDEDAGQAALLAGDQQVAPRLRAEPGARAIAAPAERDPGPDGAQRLHLRRARRRAAQAEPVAWSRPAARSRPQAPAAIEHVLRRAAASTAARASTVEDLFQGRIRVHSTVDAARADDRQRGARERARALREAPSAGAGSIQGSVVVLRNARRRRPGRGGRPAGLQDRCSALLRLQPRHRLAAPARLGDEAVRVPGRLPPGPRPRRHGARRAHRVPMGDGAHRSGSPTTTTSSRARSRAPGPGRVAQRGRRVDRPRASACGRSIRTARELGIHTPLQPYICTALGASEVRLLELANAYRAHGLRHPAPSPT